MRRFCIKCGKEAAPEHRVCIYCGTTIPTLDDVMTKDSAESHEENRADDMAQTQQSEKQRTSDPKSDVGDTTETDGEMTENIAGDPDGTDESLPVLLDANNDVEQSSPATPTSDSTSVNEVDSQSNTNDSVEQEFSKAKIPASQTIPTARTQKTTESQKSAKQKSPAKSEKQGKSAKANSPEKDAQKTRAATKTKPHGASGTNAQTQSPPPTKGGVTNKKKSQKLWRIGSAVAIVLIALFMWGKSYTSLEAVEERFMKAVDSRNVSKVQKMMVHNDRSGIEKFEAEAFLDLVKQDGRQIIYALTDTVYNGKFLLLFDSYKISAQDQIAYDDKIDDVIFTFNENEVPIFDENEYNVFFGPLVPGVYEVEATLNNDFGYFSEVETVTLDSPSYQDHTYMGIYFPASEVSIYVENVDDFGYENVTVQINDEKYPVDEYGDTDIIGPMLLDGTVEATVISTLPWGEIESKTYEIYDSNPWINAAYLDDKHVDDLMNFLSEFGDQYIEAKATNDTDVIKLGSDFVKEYVADRQRDDMFYVGQLDKIEISRNAVYTHMHDDGEIILYLPGRFIVNEDAYYPVNEPIFSDYSYDFLFELIYDEKEKSWFVRNFMDYDWYDDVTDERDGSGTMFAPDEKTVASATEQSQKQEMLHFIYDYTDASVQAINNRDFSLVEPYLTKDGPRHDEARDYIDYLESKGIYETWLESSIRDIKEIDDHTWEITVFEVFIIERPDSEDTWGFETELLIKKIDGEYLVDELLSTEQIEDYS